jgi:3-hydroxymyristoyl/3-hydroxydecanoyl-(acyl carrier protein) dehydratase
MTLRDVLVRAGLESFVGVFEAQRVTLEDLPHITDADLAGDFGMHRYMDRKRLRAALAGQEVGAPTDQGATRAGSLPAASGAETRVAIGSAFDLPARVGSYVVLGWVGAGSQGVVARARHADEAWARRQGDVALKFIHPHLAAVPAVRERFVAEAHVGRRLSHPSLATVYDIIVEGPWLAMAMEYVDGAPLAASIRPGGMPLDAALALLTPLADAIDHLHAAGVVHRDVKPDNVRVRMDGRPVLLDLGVARESEGAGTRTGMAIGTRVWMAPEQAEGRRVDGAADRYALGLVAYALLAGRMPWSDGTSKVIADYLKVKGELVPLARPDVGAHVRHALMGMLAAEPAARPASARAWVEAMRAPLATVGAQMFVAELASPGVVEVVVGGMIRDGKGAGAKPTWTHAPSHAGAAPAAVASPSNGGGVAGGSPPPHASSLVHTKRVDAAGYAFLRDHAIAGAPVFPMVLAIEWMVEMATAMRPGAVVTAVRNLKVLKGIRLERFEGGGDIFEVQAVGDGATLQLEIRSPGGPAHYRATVEVAAQAPARAAAPPDRALPGYAHALDEVYGRFLFHGPGFQVIRHVVGADNAGMEATLSGTHDMNWPTNGWLTDLAAFDGGLQLALLWNRLHTDAASLPTAIGAFRSYGAPAPGPVRCVLTGRRLAGRAVASDLAFVDVSGTVFAALDGVETHALPSGAFPTAATLAASAPAPIAPPAAVVVPSTTARPGPKLSRRDLEDMSRGPISRHFGAQFAPQDAYARVVRMPEPPLLLCDRVTGIAGPAATLGKGTIWTETDVTEESWYLHERHIPAGVMIEAGQADLLLVSWQGVDLNYNKGERMYRLVGCDLRYEGGLPTVGDTLKYEIQLDGHAKLGDARLFFFHYDCKVNDAVRLTVREGKAGFFSKADLDKSGGVLWDAATAEVDLSGPVAPPAVVCEKSSFSKEDLLAFTEGRVADAFGPGFERAHTHAWTPKIAGGRMLFFDRVTKFDPAGGPWKRGYLAAECDITGNNWFFDGHFFNDPCMPETLMFEGCLQALQVYMTGLGHTLKRDGWRFEPKQGETFHLCCRGQVIPTSKLLTYEIFVQEVGLDPVPYVRAHMMCTVDGLKSFHAYPLTLVMVPD